MTLADNTSIGISNEDTYGTFSETGQVHMYVENVTPKTDPTLSERADITGTVFGLSSIPTRKVRNTAFRAKMYPGNEIGYLLRNLFGTPSTTGAGPYTHVWPLLEAKLLTKWTSVEISEGGNTADDYDGGVIGSFTVAGGNEGYVTIEVNMVHQGRVAGTVAGSYSFSAIAPYTYCMAVVNYDSSEIKVDNWTVNVDMNYRLDNFKSGDCEIQKPVPNGKPIVTASFEIDNADFTYRDLYEAGTADKPFSVVLTHTALAGGATPYSLKIELPETQITANDRSGETGQLKETVELMGLVGTSDGANTTNLECTCVNATASYA